MAQGKVAEPRHERLNKPFLAAYDLLMLRPYQILFAKSLKVWSPFLRAVSAAVNRSFLASLANLTASFLVIIFIL